MLSWGGVVGFKLLVFSCQLCILFGGIFSECVFPKIFLYFCIS